jgi:hypothetical protein
MRLIEFDQLINSLKSNAGALIENKYDWNNISDKIQKERVIQLVSYKNRRMIKNRLYGI